MALAKTIINTTDTITAAIMISMRSTMPTAVMMESSEKTKSISMIWTITDTKVACAPALCCPSNPSRLW